MPPAPSYRSGVQAAAAVEAADLGPHRYCVPCTVRWRGDSPCFSCDGPGALREITDPPGWPQLTVPPAVTPGQAA